jgi:hypothetical protein
MSYPSHETHFSEMLTLCHLSILIFLLFHIMVCVRARACMRVCARVHACMHVHMYT